MIVFALMALLQPTIPGCVVAPFAAGRLEVHGVSIGDERSQVQALWALDEESESTTGCSVSGATCVKRDATFAQLPVQLHATLIGARVCSVSMTFDAAHFEQIRDALVISQMIPSTRMMATVLNRRGVLVPSARVSWRKGEVTLRIWQHDRNGNGRRGLLTLESGALCQSQVVSSAPQPAADSGCSG